MKTSTTPNKSSQLQDSLILNTMPKVWAGDFEPSTDRICPLWKCGTWATIGECSDCGQSYAVRHVCGREWCPDCGARDSIAHHRRIARWLPKLQTFKSVGYWVITFPHDSARPESKEALQWRYKQIMLVFRCSKAYPTGLYEHGLARWHFFGEPKNGERPTYHPHLNILVEGRHIGKHELQAIKGELRLRLGVPNLVVHYSYKATPTAVYHALSYVTRATFLDYKWAPRLAAGLYNFHSCRSWGVWRGRKQLWSLLQPREAYDEYDDLKSCPRCGGKINWDRKTLPWDYVSGVYEVEEMRPYVYRVLGWKVVSGATEGAFVWG